jgi:hypothetical protein
MRLAICSLNPTVSTDPTDPQCLDGTWETNGWSPIQTPINVDPASQNLTQISLPVFFDPPGSGNSPLPSHDVLGEAFGRPGFYCDNTTDPCAIEVTEEQGRGNAVVSPPDSSSNTLIFPLTFAAEAEGCPSGDAAIQTDSSFSLEHFMPQAVDATCNGKDGVVALNTTTDNLSVLANLTGGGASVAFVDDPGDPSVESALAGKHYAFIPVAVSATVVAFLAAQNLQGQIAYPLSVYNLTPNMVAGLITSAYQSASGSPVEVDGQEVPGDSDNLIPPLKCEYLKGCPNNQGLQVYNELPYNTFSLLNPAATGVNPPAVFGSFMSNISNGSSYGVTKWICAAPNMPISVTVDEKTTKKGKYKERTVSLTDPNVADHTLTTAPGSTIWPPYVTPTQPNGPPWVFPTCQGYSTFPALASGDTDYSESQNPSFQAKSIRSYAYSGNELPVISPTPLAGFGVMDSSEADYNGLNSASLQNADGNFVVGQCQPLRGRPVGLSGRHLCHQLLQRLQRRRLLDSRHHLRRRLDQAARGRPGDCHQEPADQSGDLLA